MYTDTPFFRAIEKLRKPEEIDGGFVESLSPRIQEVLLHIRDLTGQEAIEGYRRLIGIVAGYDNSVFTVFLVLFSSLRIRAHTLAMETRDDANRFKMFARFKKISAQNLSTDLDPMNLHAIVELTRHKSSRA